MPRHLVRFFLLSILALASGCAGKRAPSTPQPEPTPSSEPAPPVPAPSEAAEPPAPVAASEESGVVNVRLTVELADGVRGPVFIAGNLPQLGPWDPARFKMEGDGPTRTATLWMPSGHRLEYKLTQGGWDTEETFEGNATGGNRILEPVGPDATTTIKVLGFKKGSSELLATINSVGIQGTVEVIPNVTSQFGLRPRNVLVLLPQEYDRDPNRRFGVLYVHDGQNMFDPRMSPTGTDWGLDEALARLTTSGAIQPVIVAAIFNTADRMEEYSASSPTAVSYSRFVTEELKPKIDARYRTLADPANTATMGSSLGALASLHLAWHHPDAFGRAICVSSSFGFKGARVINDAIEKGPLPRSIRIYMDIGTREGGSEEHAALQRRFADVLTSQGWVEGRDFIARYIERAEHNEGAWRARLDSILLDAYSLTPGQP